MALEQNSQSSELSRVEESGIVDKVRGSLSLKLIITGIVFIAVGAVLQTGVWSAIFPLWGVGLILAGTGAILLIRFLRSR